jgi:protein O-GlcNAc transferase
MLLAAQQAQCESRFDEADALFRRYMQAAEPDKRISQSWNNLGNVLKARARIDEALDCYKKAISIDSANRQAQDDYLNTLNVYSGFDAAAILRENRRWGTEQARQIEPYSSHDNDRSPDRRLRVGYVSPHFHAHVSSFFVLPLLAEHKRDAVEVFCYSDALANDALADRTREQSDGWRETSGMSDAGLAELVRQDRIDILVDLASHLPGNRLLAFARRPAPVQISWLAYPGTTGLAAMDYRLSDPYLDPPGKTEGDYVEQTARLPATFWCYHPLTDRPDVNELPALKNGFVTYGSLNNFCKLNEETLARWARVMAAVGGSRLILLAPKGSARQWVLDVLSRSAGGIEAGRVEFVDHQPRPRYLETYHRIDIGLDTLPYNGHTTTLDALWMGVPVVTQVGQTAVGRGGWSQCCNMELDDLAGWTADQFVKIAVDLASDLEGLKTLRMRMRGRMLRSPLMNAKRFAAGMEEIYRTLWRVYCGRGR